MGYKNGKQILPERLLEELQAYVQGELIYIPRKGENRAGWGENNGTRKALRKRNREIFIRYKEGFSIDELMDMYNLSEDSIRKIILKTSKEVFI